VTYHSPLAVVFVSLAPFTPPFTSSLTYLPTYLLNPSVWHSRSVLRTPKNYTACTHNTLYRSHNATDTLNTALDQYWKFHSALQHTKVTIYCSKETVADPHHVKYKRTGRYGALFIFIELTQRWACMCNWIVPYDAYAMWPLLFNYFHHKVKVCTVVCTSIVVGAHLS